MKTIVTTERDALVLDYDKRTTTYIDKKNRRKITAGMSKEDLASGNATMQNLFVLRGLADEDKNTEDWEKY